MYMTWVTSFQECFKQRMRSRGRSHSRRLFARLYPPELTLTRQKGCIGEGSRVADVVAGDGGTTMCALVIRDDISPEELWRQARQESDGRVAARLFAIANALEGWTVRARRGGPGWTGRPCATGFIATTRQGLRGSATDRRRGARRS